MCTVKHLLLLAAAAAIFPGAAAAAAVEGQQAAGAPQAQESVPAARAFVPPADGRLTPDQVKMYIGVRRRAIAATPRVSPGEADAGQIARALASLTSDATAAADAGVDLDEYRWVSARIAETDPAAVSASAQILDALNAAISRTGVVPAPSDAPPAVSASAEQATAARVAYNRRLLDKYRSDLDALRRTSRP